MDVGEARRTLFTRVQGFDADNAFKIMGYLLLQDWGEQDFLHLALGSDVMLHSLITKAKKELGLNNRFTAHHPGQSLLQSQTEINIPLPLQMSSQSLIPHGIQPVSSQSFYTTENSKVNLSNLNPCPHMPASQVNEHWTGSRITFLQDKVPVSHEPFEEIYPSSGGSFNMLGQSSFLPVQDQNNLLQMPAKWASPSLMDASSGHLNTFAVWKPCLFFSRGYCKHGTNCRFLHCGEKYVSTPTSLPTEDYLEALGSDDGFLTLDCLEQELRELLRGRRTPVSIASLPQLYYEKFGKTLQAEGYLTESQCHGKAGYSLTKLLVRLRGIITLIERPHGQHAVVLTEDAHKFMDFRGNRDDYSAINPSSRQIYLTFPAESTFTEEDVTIHFRAYGPVQEVRIPYQQKRMFGFVTFTYADTVRTILAEGNPHYICGAKVLVKPYKEKTKLGDRKPLDRDHSKHVPAIIQLPLARSPEEYQFAQCIEDDRIFALERKLADLQLTGAPTQFSEPIAVTSANNREQEGLTEEFEIGDSSEDTFHLHSTTFKYVLDILEGENKDNDTTDSTSVTVPQRLDSKVSDSSFENPNISETFANTVGKIKSHHFDTQKALLSQYSWGAPTLFARSVF